ENEEEGRLHIRRDRDAELPDHDGRQQGGRDRTKADALEGELAHVVADAQGEKERDLRIGTQCLSDPFKHEIGRARVGKENRNVTGVQTCALPIWKMRKKVDFTFGEIVMPSCPITTAASRVAVTAPRPMPLKVNLPT